MVGKATVFDRATGTGSLALPAPRVPLAIRWDEAPRIDPTKRIRPPKVRPNKSIPRGTASGIDKKKPAGVTRFASTANGQTLFDRWVAAGSRHQFASTIEQVEQEPALLRMTTSLISGSRSLQEALGIVEKLQPWGSGPNVQVYGALIAKADQLGRPDMVLALKTLMEKDEIEPNAFILTSVIKALGKLGRSDEAAKTFDRIGAKADLKAFGAMMSVHANRGDTAAFEKLYLQLEKRNDLMADDRIRGTRVIAYARSGQLTPALAFFHKMLEAGIFPHLAVCNTLIAACGKYGSSDVALSVFRSMVDRGATPNSVTLSALMRACVSSDDRAVTFAAIEAGRQCGLLRDSLGYDETSRRLSLWPKDLLASETEWRCPDSELPAVGQALAQLHLARSKTIAGVDGPDLAKRAAVAVCLLHSRL